MQQNIMIAINAVVNLRKIPSPPRLGRITRTTTVFVVVLTRLLPLHCWALSIGHGGASSSRTATNADACFDEWCDRNGIVRVHVRTVTTPRSLGGRGLFATRSLQSGSVVASIPSDLVLVENNNNIDDDDDDKEEEEEWQVSLTQKVLELCHDPTNEWIQSWNGSGSLDIESLLWNRHDDACVEEYVDRLVVGNDNDSGSGNGSSSSSSITRSGAQQEIQNRIDNYSRRLERLRFLLDNDNNKMKNADENEIVKMYTLVMSRSAYLGKDWDYKCGIIPFFDMLNHCHDENRSNTELMSFGTFLDKMQQTSDSHHDNDESIGLDRNDLLLVLNQDVKEGDELLTQYAHDIDKEETQLKLWIQYGIPPPPPSS